MIIGCCIFAATFASECLSAHNRLRSFHKDTIDLIWDEELADQAENHIHQQLQDTGIVTLSCPEDSQCSYGENLIIMEMLSADVPLPCAFASFYWYMQSIDYDYSKSYADQGKDVTQFTQTVWRDSESVGCGRSNRNETWYIMCHYVIPGNIDPERSIENVRSLEEGVVIPKKPQDLMNECPDLYSEDCDTMQPKCEEIWGDFYGPSTYCPVTCGVC